MRNDRFAFFSSIINNIHMEILEHGYLYGDSGWKYFNISSPFNRLYFVTGGNGYIANARERVKLEKGNAYIIPAHTTYDYICDNYIEKFYAHFRLELFSGQDLFEPVNACLWKPFDEEALAAMLSRIKNHRMEDMLYCKAFLLKEASGFVIPGLEQEASRIPIVLKYRKVYEYIKNNCHAGMTVKELAGCMGMPSYQLSKSFRLDTGETLKCCISKKLVQTAKERLLLTGQSVKEVAFSLGFTDEFYFSRFFKKHVGVAPREYRENNKIAAMRTE